MCHDSMRSKNWMAVPFLLFAIGCSKNNPTAPDLSNPNPVPSPDVHASGLKFLQPSISFGGWSPGMKRSRQAPQGEGHLFLGERGVPVVELGYAGQFPNLVVNTTVNGQPYASNTLSYGSNDGYQHWTTYSAPPWSPPDTGTYVIAMALDPSDVYPEVDETNNRDTMVVHVSEGNLWPMEIQLSQTVGAIEILADTVHTGTEVHITVRTFCVGGYPSFRVVVLEEGGPILLDTTAGCTSGLFPGVNVFERTWVAASPGVHSFTVMLDPDGLTRESQQDDNVLTKPLVVIP